MFNTFIWDGVALNPWLAGLKEIGINHNRSTALEQSVISDCRSIKSEMRSFKSNENIHKKKGGLYYVVSANKASSVTL